MSFNDFPISFENPIYGFIGIALGSAAIALFYLSHNRLRIAEKRLELVEWRNLRRIVRIVNIGTKTGVVIALSVLLATPYFPATIEVSIDKASEEQLGQYRVAVMLLMDVSYSMNYSDLKPTRFDVSKSMANLLLDKMAPDDLVGFIAFAGQIYDTFLPTTNRTKVKDEIGNQTLHPSTAMGNAIEAAIGVLESYSSGGRAIVLFSDGKNNLGLNVTLAADETAAQKIPVFTVSLGTYGLVEADPLALKRISNRTGGEFYDVRNTEMGSLAASISEISREVKVGALEAVYDKLILPAKDYHTPTTVFSALLLAALLVTWFTGV